MKKTIKFTKFLKTKNLEKAVSEHNIGKALDIISTIRDDKKPELSKKVLLKVESHLLFILNNISLDKKIITSHFTSILKTIQDFINLESNQSTLVI